MRVLLVILLMLISLPVYALQATINLPNSEVLEEDTILMKDVTYVYPKGKVVNTAPNITYGVAHEIELSIGVPVIMNYDTDKTVVKSAIEGKKVFYIYDKNNRITVGAGIYPYLNKEISPEGFIFAHATRKIEKTGTSFSIGGYTSGDKTLLNSGGLLMILDQKIYKDIHLLSEYTTGNGSRSNYSAGIKYKIKGVSITNSVIVPNHGNSIGFQLILAKTIGVKK